VGVLADTSTVNACSPGWTCSTDSSGGDPNGLTSNLLPPRRHPDRLHGGGVEVVYGRVPGDLDRPPAGAGTGDVVGPASSVDSEIALFDGATGKLLKSATGPAWFIAHLAWSRSGMPMSATIPTSPPAAPHPERGFRGGDAELFTQTKDLYLDDPTAADAGKDPGDIPSRRDHYAVWCSTTPGRRRFQFDERAEATPNTGGTDVLTAPLICDSNTEATAAFATPDRVRVPVNLDVDSVASTPTKLRIHIEFTLDD